MIIIDLFIDKTLCGIIHLIYQLPGMNMSTMATISAMTIIVAIVFLFLPLKNLKKFTIHLNLSLFW